MSSRWKLKGLESYAIRWFKDRARHQVSAHLGGRLMHSEIDRRKFIRTGGTVAGALAFATWTKSSMAQTDDDKPSNKKIRMGIIGCGSVSRMYFPNLSACPYAEII